MKIAIIASGFLPVVDGVTVSGFQRLRKLSEWGHQVLFFCPDYRALQDVYPDWKNYTGDLFPGVRVVSLKSNGLMGFGFDRNVSFFAYPSVLKALKEFQPDIIHVDEPERLFLGFLKVPGIGYARSANIPCVSFYRTNFIEYVDDYFILPSSINALIRFAFIKIFLYIYGCYEITLVSSRITYKKIVELGFKNAEYRNLLGFDFDAYTPDLKAAEFFEQTYQISGLERKVKIIFLGRLTPDKGWEFTIDCLSALGQEIDLKEIALVLAGDGPMRDEIMTRLSDLGFEVRFLGRVSPDRVPSLLMNCDIHVTTSEKETRGLTILEAFAAGIPVLAPNRGGVVENIQDGRNGFLYHPGDRVDFLQKLVHLIRDRPLREAMGRHGREGVADYSWDRTIANLVEVWEEQIERYDRSVAKT
ncbi:glycosyltransferase [Altericista sp. CCNU0014]|uniref:glycosyltransferase n=1 Tax=Altericista sp. CCNU0014 TaxID=3082949 RepID=UPI00385020D1